MDSNFSDKITRALTQANRAVAPLYSRLIGFVFPPQCVICEQLHESEDYFICGRCRHSLLKYDSPYCPACHQKLDFGKERCAVCRTRSPVSKVVAVGDFDDILRPLIHAYKYQGVVPIGNFLGTLLAEQFRQFELSDKYDLIIPIPLHPSRERKRGFNQSRIIAECLADNLEIDCDSASLVRIKKTRTQTGLNREQRLDNIRDAFALSREVRCDGMNIMLVDDVTTTGATSVESAKILRKAGAKSITLGVIAAAGPDDINLF